MSDNVSIDGAKPIVSPNNTSFRRNRRRRYVIQIIPSDGRETIVQTLSLPAELSNKSL